MVILIFLLYFLRKIFFKKIYFSRLDSHNIVFDFVMKIKIKYNIGLVSHGQYSDNGPVYMTYIFVSKRKYIKKIKKNYQIIKM